MSPFGGRHGPWAYLEEQNHGKGDGPGNWECVPGPGKVQWILPRQDFNLCMSLLFFFSFLKDIYLFIHLTESERGSDRTSRGTTEGEGDSGSPLSREPDTRTPGS